MLEDGKLEADAMPQLASVSAPMLVTSTAIELVNDPQLASLDLSSLSSDTGPFITSQDPMLATCELQAIWAAAGHPGPVDMTGDDDSATCP